MITNSFINDLINSIKWSNDFILKKLVLLMTMLKN
jgi:hypothetical protein